MVFPYDCCCSPLREWEGAGGRRPTGEGVGRSSDSARRNTPRSDKNASDRRERAGAQAEPARKAQGRGRAPKSLLTSNARAHTHARAA